jgi:transposase
MKDADESLPSDLAAAHAMILAERAARLEAEAIAARAQAVNSTTEALIAHLKLEIEKLRRELYGSSSERKARLLAQMELQLEDLEAAATEDELAAEKAAVGTQTVRSFQRRRSSRKLFPDHLPRERVVIAAPDSCPCCGSAKPSKLGEDVTETLEVIPRQGKVIQTVREKFSCRQCEAITQPPVPFHVTPRGFAGPNLLAMILFEKFGQHQPLNRQSERYRREGIDLSVSTLVTRLAPARSSCNRCARRDLARKVHGTSALSVGDRAHMRFSHRREMLMGVDACSETGIRWNYGFVLSRVGFSHLGRQQRI